MTEQPPIQPTPVGALRFNTVTAQLEYFDGNVYVNITTDSPEQNTGGTRALFNLSRDSSNNTINTINFITISTTGNAVDFGDDAKSHKYCTGAGSRTRAIWSGTYNPATSDNIRFNTFASQGNGTDFGDMSYVGRFCTSASNQTRSVNFAGGNPSAVNSMDFITIAQTGNAIDFGDATISVTYSGGCGSPTRGIFSGGYTPSATNVMNFITFSTTGNAADFGDLAQVQSATNSASNAVRGFTIAGKDSSGNRSDDTTTFIIATLGSSVSSVKTLGNSSAAGATSSPTRIVFAGGNEDASPAYNSIEYKQIDTDGSFIDFGDLTTSSLNTGAASNGHGGLG